MVQNQIFGTESNDYLLDSLLDDHIVALGGNDQIEISSGSDVIDGGDGTDELKVNYSNYNEDINLARQNNYFDGTSNDGSIEINFPVNGNFNLIDFYSIESFNISSGRGNDYLDLGYDNYSNDQVYAGAGNDFIFTGNGIDIIDGEEGFDVLRLDFTQSQNGVNSQLTGNNSGEYGDGINSTTFNSIEALEVMGSSYNDVLTVVNSHNLNNMGYPSMLTMINGGEGIDTLVVDYSSINSDLGFALDAYGSINIAGSASNSSTSNINFTDIESFEIISGRGNDFLELGYDNYSDDTIKAGAGDDFISTGQGIDIVDGEEGFDVLRLDFTQSQNGVKSQLTGNNSGEYSDGVNSTNFNNIEAIEIMGSNYDDVLVTVNSHNLNNSGFYSNMPIDGGDGTDKLIVDYSNINSDLILNFNSYGVIDVMSPQSGNSSSINFQNIEGVDITTGKGNDNINLNEDGYSNDKVSTGAGNDYIFVGSSPTGDMLGLDTIDGGEGSDLLHLDFSQSQNPVNSWLTDNKSGKYSDGFNSVTFSNIEAVDVMGSMYDDVLVTVNNDQTNDTNTPPIGYQMIDGNEGFDELVVDYSESAEDLHIMLNSSANDGSVDINFYSDSDNQNQNINFSSIESFAINTGIGNDNLDLGSDNYSDDTIKAGAGDDFVFTGKGLDVVDGEEGFDLLRLDFSQSMNGVTSYLTDESSGKYSNGFDSVTFSNIEAVNVMGSMYDDTLVAVKGSQVNETDHPSIANIIDGNEGFDELIVDYSDSAEDLQITLNSFSDIDGSLDVSNYETGNNSRIDFYSVEKLKVSGSQGNDYIQGGMNNDYLIGLDGQDFLEGGLGSDTILGGLENDFIHGNEGRDRLYGNQGEDTIYGGLYHDYIRGGDGNDVLYGDEGNDKLIGDSGNDILSGGLNNDRIYAGSGDDVLHGDEGNDKLYGSLGNDAIYGGAGRDVIYGGAGDDLIYAGTGNDIVFGNAGIDIFALEPHSGYSVIRDYAQNEDSLGLTAGMSFADIKITGNSSRTKTFIRDINNGNQVMAIILNTNANTITANDFVNV